MKRLVCTASVLLMIGGTGWAQTNPTPQALPHLQDFSSLAHSSTAYPDGWQGWKVGSASSATFPTAAASGDLALTASSSASSTTGGVHNFNGKIGMLASGSSDPAIALSISTMGHTGIMIEFDVMTIRNPYNGTTNTRINEVDLQYRVGTSGTFTSVSGNVDGVYQNNTTTQTGSGVTTPQNVHAVLLSLPSACDNQPEVQLRWVQRDLSGSGSRASFAVDNVVVGTSPTITLQPTDQSVCIGSTATFSAAADAVPTPSLQWQASTDNGGSWNDIVGETNSTLNVDATFAEDGVQYRARFTNALGTQATSAAVLTVLAVPATPGPIVGSTSVNAGAIGVSYSIAAVAGATSYLWSVPAGATIASGQGTTSIMVDWGSTSGDVAVAASNTCGSSCMVGLGVTVTQVLGSIAGTVSTTNGGIPNVIVTLLDSAMLPLNDATTNAWGNYRFDNVPLGSYNVMVVEPLAFFADTNPRPAVVVDATTVDCDFVLMQLVTTNNAQKRSYWKHQFDAHIRGRGRFEETAAQLQSYIAAVQQHYTPHFNTFVSALTFADWQEALSRDRDSPPDLDKAMQELAALVLNLASLNVGQYTVVSDDGRSAGEVLTHVSQLFTAPAPSRQDYKTVQKLCKKVNDGHRIAAGEVPPSSLLYKRGVVPAWSFGVPNDLALHPNFPNPFNPTTTISFFIPKLESQTRVMLKVFDVLGREVRTLVHNELRPGRYHVTFNATGLASGAYLCRLQVGTATLTRKLLLQK